MSHLSQRPSNPVYYIEDCRILVDMLHISYGWHVGFEKNIEAALEKAGVYYLLIDTP